MREMFRASGFAGPCVTPPQVLIHSLIHEQTENKLEKPVTARGFEIRHD